MMMSKLACILPPRPRCGRATAYPDQNRTQDQRKRGTKYTAADDESAALRVAQVYKMWYYKKYILGWYALWESGIGRTKNE
jgi:hypothetical protein